MVGVPVAFRLKPSLKNLNQTIHKVGLSKFLPTSHTWLGLNCYITLQQAKTSIRSFFLVAEPPIIPA